MSSASSKSAVVSIGVTALVLVLAAQGAGFVFALMRALTGGAVKGASPALAMLPFSLGAMALAGLIMGAWIRARHASAAGLAFLAALVTGFLNGALNYFVGHDPNLTAAIARANVMPALMIGAVIGGLIIVAFLWALLLIGGLFAGAFRARPA